jgi:hypothetical protein
MKRGRIYVPIVLSSSPNTLSATLSSHPLCGGCMGLGGVAGMGNEGLTMISGRPYPLTGKLGQVWRTRVKRLLRLLVERPSRSAWSARTHGNRPLPDASVWILLL